MKDLYSSTRSKEVQVRDVDAILNSLAEDGGLYVLDDLINKVLPLKQMLTMSYQDIANTILKMLLPSMQEEAIMQCVANAYGSNFNDEHITPLKKLGGQYVLELFHGPTCAFKDIGLQLLPQLMKTILKNEQKQQVMILTATSGDTGKAALAGFQDVNQVGISVFYPDGKVSEMQKLQMVTQTGRNTAVCAIQGNFDDAQSAVKTIFNDTMLAQQLMQDGVTLSSANSINIGRLIPQIVYYVYAYLQLVKQEEIAWMEEVDFCVPTGNFGNVLAGYYAKMMGLPVHKFIIASNENNVLYDFFTEGTYNRDRPFHKTISPSMDILISSNLERLLYYASNQDADYITSLLDKLQKEGTYKINDQLKKRLDTMFYAGYASDEETSTSIKKVYKDCGYIMDPHTAVGYKVMQDYLAKNTKHTCVLLSTASPYKFAPQVYQAIYDEDIKGDEFSLMEKLSKSTNTEIPKPLQDLRKLKVLHNDVIKKEDIADYVQKKIKEVLL